MAMSRALRARFNEMWRRGSPRLREGLWFLRREVIDRHPEIKWELWLDTGRNAELADTVLCCPFEDPLADRRGSWLARAVCRVRGHQLTTPITFRTLLAVHGDQDVSLQVWLHQCFRCRMFLHSFGVGLPWRGRYNQRGRVTLSVVNPHVHVHSGDPFRG